MPAPTTPPAALLFAIMAVMVLSTVLASLNQRYASPVIAIFNRWMRWVIFAFGTAYFCRDFGLMHQGYWTLVAAFFLIWFLGETLYNWLAIHALSVSPLPLFPRYVVNPGGEEWPVQSRLLKVREWLRANGYKRVQAVKAEIGGGLHLRVSIYQDADACLRVQVLFLPQGNGSIAICTMLLSQTADGFRYITDNLYIPFGGFYPENWLVDRTPWCRGLARLIKRHRARLARSGAVCEPWTGEPVADLNAQQGELDRLNTELGFLHPRHEREDHGKITHQGRYRVWKEIWMLDYFGRSTRYE